MSTNAAFTDQTVEGHSEAALVQQLGKIGAKLEADPEGNEWKVFTFQNAMQASNVRPPWIIEDLLLAETATLVSAQPHCMKSLSWLAACLEAVAFQQVWNHFPARNVKRALFIETEDPAWLVESRIRGLAKGLGLKPTDPVDGFRYACIGPFDLEGSADKIRALMDEHRPDFVVLSTLQNLLAGKDWNNQKDMQPIMAAVVRLARVRPIVLITHSPWDTRQKRAAGSVTQTANFVTALHYEKDRGAAARGTLAFASLDSKVGSNLTNFSLRLEVDGDRLDPGSVRRIIFDQKWKSGNKKLAIEDALKENPDASNKEIAEETGADVRYVQKIRKGAKEFKDER